MSNQPTCEVQLDDIKSKEKRKAFYEQFRYVQAQLHELQNLYCSSEQLVYVCDQKQSIHPYASPHLAVIIGESFDHVNEVEKYNALANTILTSPPWPKVNVIDQTANMPILLPDGVIRHESGYEPHSKTYIWPLNKNWNEIHWPAKISYDEAKQGYSNLVSLLSDFPFQDDDHLSAAIALILTASCRFAYQGRTPFFYVDGSGPGVGKTLLGSIAAILMTGKKPSLLSYPYSREELDKILSAMALEAESCVFFDNITSQIGGDTLERAITSSQFKGRVLGQTRSFQTDFSPLWIGTSNNGSLTYDMKRRTIPIRLVSDMEDPHNRTEFRIPDILDHVLKHREQICSEAIKVVKGYIDADTPKQLEIKTLGSFESWTNLIPASIVWLDGPNPMESRKILAETLSDREQFIHAILPAIYQAYRSSPFRSQNLINDHTYNVENKDRVQIVEALKLFPGKRMGEFPNATSLGRLLSSFKDRWVNGYQLMQGPKRHGQPTWCVNRQENESVELEQNYSDPFEA